MNAKNLDALSSLLFHVEKVETSKIAKGFMTNSKDAYSIVGHPAGGKIILNTCSERYNVIKNEEILLPLMDLVEREFEGLRLSVINENDARFHVSIIPAKKKAIVGEILPRFQYSNSYDGIIPAHISGGLYRTTCANGAAAPIHGKTFVYKFKHNDREILLPSTWGEVTSMMQVFLSEFPVIEKSIVAMKSKIVSPETLTKVMESIAQGTGFPKKSFATAINKAYEESAMINETLNIWLAYNGLNYILNHDRDIKIAQHVRNEMDAKLFDNALAMAE